DLAARPIRSSVLAGHMMPVYHLAISPDGKTLASTGESSRELAGSSELKVWGPDTGRAAGDPTGYKGTARQPALFRDSETRAVTLRGANIAAIVWDLAARKIICNFGPTGGNREIFGAAFAPDGSTLVTGEANDLRFWNMPDESTLARLKDNRMESSVCARTVS